jgi:hypothetical protein
MRQEVEPFAEVIDCGRSEPRRALQWQQVVDNEVNGCAMRAPSTNLPPVFREQVRGKIEAEELVAWTDANRRGRSRNEFGLQEIDGRITIAVASARENRPNLEAGAAPSTQFRPDRSYYPLDARLGVMTHDRGNVDQEPRSVSARQIAKTPAIPP